MNFYESHVHSFKSQTNVYCSCVVPWPPSRHSLLVKSLQHTESRVFCFNYQPSANGELRPSVQAIQFLYIPPDSEVVSIDAFCSLSSHASPVVGITLVKAAARNKHFLNIYGARLQPLTDDQDGQKSSESVPVGWKDIAEDWQACDLDYVPLKLSHAPLKGDDVTAGTAFLLSGSDARIHLFRSMPKPKNWMEDPDTLASHFPELCSTFGACVTALDTRSFELVRYSAVGLQNGQVRLSIVDVAAEREACVLNTWSSDCLDGPVTSLCLFGSCEAEAALPPCWVESGRERRMRTAGEEGSKSVSLMVGCAVEMAAVFSDIERLGLSGGVALPRSDRHDSVLCVCTADLDWDGQLELIIGTYGQRLLVYKQTEEDPSLGSVSSCTSQFKVAWECVLAQPINNVVYADIVGDGVPDLVVVTLLGIHVFQHDLSSAAFRCTQRLSVWTKIERLRELIRQTGQEPCV